MLCNLFNKHIIVNYFIINIKTVDNVIPSQKNKYVYNSYNKFIQVCL